MRVAPQRKHMFRTDSPAQKGCRWENNGNWNEIFLLNSDKRSNRVKISRQFSTEAHCRLWCWTSFQFIISAALSAKFLIVSAVSGCVLRKLVSRLLLARGWLKLREQRRECKIRKLSSRLSLINDAVSASCEKKFRVNIHFMIKNLKIRWRKLRHFWNCLICQSIQCGFFGSAW